MPSEQELRRAVEEIANAVQVIALLSTRLRRNLGEQVEAAVALEAEASRAVRVLRTLEPKE